MSYQMKLTDIGRAKDANALLHGGTPLDFYEVAVGDGQAEPDYTAGTLQNERWRGLVSGISVSPTDPSIIEVTGLIPSEVGGFTIRELGFFDQAGDMIALVKTPETERLDPALGQLTEQHIIAHITVANAAEVTLLVDPSVIMASRAYVDAQIAALKVSPAHSIIGQIWRG